jgi:hypothetical protein
MMVRRICTSVNISMTIWRLKCYYETFVKGAIGGVLLNFSSKNSPDRQTEIW